MAIPDMLGMVVRDMGATLRFYRLLGLDIPAEADAQPHVEVTLPGGFRLTWDTVEMMRGIYPDWAEPSGHRSALAFLCDAPADVDALYAKVTATGYVGHKAPWDAFWGQRYAVVLDPDGYWIDLFAPLESA